MSTHPQLESKQILDGSGIVVRICPATSGLPTRMSEAGWQALCKSTRRRELAAPSGDGYGSNAAGVIRRRLNYCAVCQGKIRPKGLEIIPAAELAALKQQHQEDVTMAKVGGKCTTCGRASGALSICHGERLCASCSAVYSAINNRPQVVLAGLRKLKPEALLELAGAPAVQVSVESEALKRIAEAMDNATMPDCDGCAEGYDEQIADLQVEVERLRAELAKGKDGGKSSRLDDLIRALDCPNEQWELAAIQTAALLEETERQLDESRCHGLRKNDAMREQWEDMAAINHATGLPEDAPAEQIVATIGSLMHAVDRFRDLAESADKRADLAEAENNRLADLLEQQNDSVAQYIDPYREALADFGLAVIRGEAALSFGGR